MVLNSINSKQKILRYKKAALRLDNVSKYFLTGNMKKTALNGYFCDFSVNYDIDVADILDIHKYLTLRARTVF